MSASIDPTPDPSRPVPPAALPPAAVPPEPVALDAAGQARLAAGRACVGALLLDPARAERLLASVEGRLEALEQLLAARGVPAGAVPAGDAAQIEALGVVWGDVLAECFRLTWVQIRDEHGATAALHAPGTSLVMFPLQMISKRLAAGEGPDLRRLLEALASSVPGFVVAAAPPSGSVTAGNVTAGNVTAGDVAAGGMASSDVSVPTQVTAQVPAASGGPEPAVAQRPVLLSARGVTKAYKVGGARLEVLKGVDLDVHQGEILAVLGKSGCGKSTLLHVLGWLDKADAGEIRYEGQDRNGLPASERARQRNRVMGFVFQFYHLMPELSALENVLMPAMIREDGGGWRAHRNAATERARALLAMVGLGARMHHRPAQLSGGERQRVAIARALENQPRFLLCDEPTGNLDGRTADDVRALLWGLNRSHGQTMVIVTHDARLAAEAHRVVHIAEGRVVEGAADAPLVAVLPDRPAPGP